MNTGNGFDKRPEDTRKGGKPKGSKNWATRIKLALKAPGEDGISEWVKVVAAIVEKAKAGDVRAAEFLANRMEGLPKATLETQEIKPINVIYLEGNTDIQEQPSLEEEGSN